MSQKQTKAIDAYMEHGNKAQLARDLGRKDKTTGAVYALSLIRDNGTIVWKTK